MLRFVLKEPDGKERIVFFEKDVVRVGKSSTNDLILPQPAVSRRHAIIRRTGGKVVVEDLVSTNGTFVNGKRISGPQEITLRDRIYVANYVLHLDMITSDEEPTIPTVLEGVKTPESQLGLEEKSALESLINEDSQELFDEGMKTIALTEQEIEEWIEPAKSEKEVQPWKESALEQTPEKASTEELDLFFEEEKEPPSIELFEEKEEKEEEEKIPVIALSEEDILEVYGAEPSKSEGDISSEELEVPALGAWMEAEKEMPFPEKEELAEVKPFEKEAPLERPEEISTRPDVADLIAPPSKKAAPVEADLADVASLIYKRLIDQPELCRRFLEPDQDVDNKQIAFQNAVRSLIDEGGIEIPLTISREELIQRMMEETIQPGIVEHLMADRENRSILINGKDSVFIERSGRIERTEYSFSCDGAVMAVVSWMLAKVGKNIDSTNSMVDARLENGAELHAIFPPQAPSGPYITIRQPGDMQFTMDDLREKESLSKEMAQFLKVSVENGMNILITGARGSGKTSLLSALASVIPEEERIITIEEWPELKLHQENVVSLLARPPQVGGQGAVTVMDLASWSLQMWADKLILGGCSCEEATEIIQASRGATRGIIAAVHADSPRHALSQLALSKGQDKNPWAILPWIGSMVDLIAQCVCMTDGRRRVIRICELADSPDDPLALRDIFRFESSGFDKETGLAGRFVPQNIVPRCIEEIEMRGVLVDREMFQKPPYY